MLIFLFVSANFISCTADSISNDDDIQIEAVTTGEDGEIEDEDEGGGEL